MKEMDGQIGRLKMKNMHKVNIPNGWCFIDWVGNLKWG